MSPFPTASRSSLTSSSKRSMRSFCTHAGISAVGRSGIRPPWIALDEWNSRSMCSQLTNASSSFKVPPCRTVTAAGDPAQAHLSQILALSIRTDVDDLTEVRADGDADLLARLGGFTVAFQVVSVRGGVQDQGPAVV